MLSIKRARLKRFKNVRYVNKVKKKKTFYDKIEIAAKCEEYKLGFTFNIFLIFL